MARANIHGIVRRLLDRGLVTQMTDATDARKTMIRLSSKGRRVLERLEPVHWEAMTEAMAEAMAVLDPPERSEFLRLLKKFCRVT